MNRRDFLAVGTVVGASTAVSCGALLPLGPGVEGWSGGGASELERLLGGLDRRLEAVGDRPVLPRPAAGARLSPEARSTWEADEALAQQGLRALLFGSTYLDLCERDRQHPVVQRRVERWLPELHEAVLGMTGKIAELSSDRAASVQQTFRADPELGLTISEKLDGQAKRFEVPLGRRLQMRTILTHHAWRMRVQSPSLVADEYLTRMHKVVALSGHAEELRRELGRRVTQDALSRYEGLVPDGWGRKQAPATAAEGRLVMASSSPASGPSSSPSGPAVRGPAGGPPLSPLEPERKPRRGRLLLAGTLVASFSSLWLIPSIGIWASGGAFTMGLPCLFHGGLGILIGLLILIVGASRGHGF